MSATAVTIIDIVNQTFSNIGLDPIEEIDYTNSATKAIRHFKAQYESLRKSILREVPWSFATAFSALEPAGIDSVLKDYAYVYKIPKDCIYARRIDKSRDGDPIEFRRVNSLIYTNEENPVLEYTKDANEVHRIDPTFIIALSHRIAAELAKSVCADQNKLQVEMQMYQQAIIAAETQTQRESEEKKESYSPIYDAMFS